ncbi:MAG TPA: penicillin acylase family protein [Blastocatellia bacterium]|jgi:penicillin amidase
MKKFTVILALAVMAQAAISGSRAVSTSPDDLAEKARAALAQTSGRIELAGLAKPVEVIRDFWGVAHIYAQTTEDLFFTQGFVAAQDRLWQMEMWRRTGEGKLAEVLGPQAVERDRFARLMRYRGDMEAEWKSYAPDARPIIESFVRGVNAFIETSRDRLPIEFQLTGIRPELWTPEVCLTRMAGYVMTGNASREVLRAQLVRLLGTEKTEELFPTDPFKKLVVPEGLDLKGIDNRILAAANAAGASISFQSIQGSNNWVVDGSLSSTGKPLLANDPHRPVTLPSLRYLVHLNGPGWNVIGAGEPTLPGVAAGHNERVGFGFTIVGIDQQDLYVEETNAQDSTLYLYKGKWEKMRIEREQIRAKGKPEPVEVELRFTRHGPVIYEDAGLHRAYALRWVGTEPGSAGYLASLSLNRAKNWNEFLKALERWKVPSENLVYADVDGNIGWQAAGLAPVRRGWSGLLPVPGSSGAHEWSGFLPLSELPWTYNPSRHFIATANHKIIPDGYKHEINFDWSAPTRFQRIEEVLSRGGKFTVADFERLQHDELSIVAREIVPLLKSLKVDDAQTRQAIELLTNWDFVLSKDSPAAALYEVWNQRMAANFARAVVPAEAEKLISEPLIHARMIRTIKSSDTKVLGPNAEAKRDLLMSLSLAEAASELRSRFGAEMKKWRWGDLHVVHFRHPLSTGKAPQDFFDLKTVARGGDNSTVNATSGANFRQTSGASFREILDLSDWDNSVAVNVPGQSGQPLSPHYQDLLPLWEQGKYFPLLFSREKIERHAAERLMLVPKDGAQ